MIARSRLVGKKLTLLLIGRGDDDREEAATFVGTVAQEGEGLVFVRPGGEALPLKDEWLPRVERVKKEARGWLLDADFVLRLEVGGLSGEEGPPDYIGIPVELGVGKKG